MPRCPKFDDDFAVNSADNGGRFRPGPARYSDLPARTPHDIIELIGLAFGASLALSTAAFAQDITIAVAGPMTGGESAFGRQMKNGAEQAVADFNAAGGVLGKKLALEVGDPREREIPALGRLALIDPESGERIEIDTSRRQVRERFAELERERRAVVAREMRRLRVEHVVLDTDRQWLHELGRRLR